MSARAWRGRKPGPGRYELRWAQAMGRATRNPGRWVHAPGGGLLCFDELGGKGIPGWRKLLPPVRNEALTRFGWDLPDPAAAAGLRSEDR